MAAPSATAAPVVDATYDFGSYASGKVQGSCMAGMISFEASPNGRLVLDGSSAAVDWYGTEVNISRYWHPGDPDPLVIKQVADQWSARDEVPAGRVEIEWTNGVARVYGPGMLATPQPFYPEPFRVRFEAASFNASEYVGGIDKNNRYYSETDLGIVGTYAGLLGDWYRWLELASDAKIGVAGEVSVYLENATIRAPGYEYNVPPRRESHYYHREEVVDVEQYRINHVVLRVKAAEWVSHEGTLKVACNAMEYSVNGTLVMVGASGRIGNESIQERELQLVGNFTVREEPPVEDSTIGASGPSTAMVEGGVRAVGYDLGRLEAFGIVPDPGVAAWVWVGAAAGGAAGAWALGRIGLGLFTRLTRDRVLEHPKRALIYQSVLSNPGISKARLATLTGLDRWLLRFHLTHLASHGLVRQFNGSKHRLTCVSGNGAHPNGHEAFPADRARGELHHIVRAKLGLGGMPLRDLVKTVCVEAKCQRSSVWYAVGALVKTGELERQERNGRIWVGVRP